MNTKILMILIAIGWFTGSSTTWSVENSPRQNLSSATIAQQYPFDDEMSDDDEMFDQMFDQMMEQIDNSDSLPHTVSLLRPIMMDENDDYPDAAYILAIWMDEKAIKFDAINSVEASTRTKVLTDSSAERGKKICITGRVVEIEQQDAFGFSIIYAQIATDFTDLMRVMAVGSKGDLVANSQATFCGIFIANVNFRNTSENSDSEPCLVGMFDLPENK